MDTPQHCMVMVTAPCEEEATRIINRLLNDKIVACGNIVKDLKSTFWWQGKLDNADEVLIIFKTTTANLIKLEQAVLEEHSYEVPEIIALPIIWSHNGYADWIDEVVE